MAPGPGLPLRALCHRGGSPAYGVGDRQGTGSLPVWRKGQSLFKKRSQAAFRRSLSKSGDRFRLPVPGGQFSCVKQKISVAKENCRGYTNTANNHPLTQLYDYIYWVYRHGHNAAEDLPESGNNCVSTLEADHLQREKKDAETLKNLAGFISLIRGCFFQICFSPYWGRHYSGDSAHCTVYYQ